MKSPGQAAYEAWLAETGGFPMPWADLSEDAHERWERIAAGIDPGPDGWKPKVPG